MICECRERSEAGTSDNFDWGKPAESQPRSKPDWILEVRWPALVKFQMTEVLASGLRQIMVGLA